MVDRPDDVVVNTDDMVMVHRVFRREFHLLPKMVRAVPDGDSARTAAVGAHADELIRGLHHHHLGEDDVLWPILEQRAAPHGDLVGQMRDQHERIASRLETIEPLLARWQQTASSADGETLSTAMEQLPAVLDEHLDIEEAQILPLVRTCVTNSEWAVLGQRGMASLAKPRLLIFLGYMFEEATPGERENFMSHLPLPPRLLYRFIGRRKYEAERDALRAGI